MNDLRLDQYQEANLFGQLRWVSCSGFWGGEERGW